jgi:ElaB/YqjD/DUF883 family membrane-anchored ribosome-binding protein
MVSHEEFLMSNEFDDFTAKAKRAATDSAAGLKEKLSSLKDLEEIEGLKEAAGELADEAAAFVRKYPVQSVLGAVAAGFLLGALINRRK